MATNPRPHPFDDEIAEIYAAYPELKDELDEMERQLDAGELDTVPHEDVRRRLQRLTGEDL